MEPVPLMLIVAAAPGSPVDGVTNTPGVRPCSNCSGDAICPLLKSFSVTLATEPVTSLDFLEP